ncbi:MAG: hypothetical protein AABM42_03060 [Actinomycetota bacterium]
MTDIDSLTSRARPASARPASAWFAPNVIPDAEPRFPDHVHGPGCPARPERIDSFEIDRPADQPSPGRFLIVRCADCGAQTATPKEAQSGD